LTEHHDDGVIRKFATGATRDTSQNKIDPEGYISPLVIQAFCEYMLEHQKQSDGSMRPSDNWQKLFGNTPAEHRDVCIKSLYRHMLDLLILHDGYSQMTRMEKGKHVTTRDALAGVMFNVMAYWFSLLKEEAEAQEPQKQ
jgi:hypothetical protein